MKCSEALAAIAAGNRVRQTSEITGYWQEYELRDEVLYVRSRALDWSSDVALRCSTQGKWSIVQRQLIRTGLTIQDCAKLAMYHDPMFTYIRRAGEWTSWHRFAANKYYDAADMAASDWEAQVR